MHNRPGRKPQPTTKPTTTITIRIPGDTKNRLIEQADAYDLTISEYITLLIHRD